jgi:hypothetical protein
MGRHSKEFETKLAAQVWAHRMKMHGFLLCIDPSSGSAGSMPGYASYVGGKLKDYGTLELPYGKQVKSKLFALALALRTEFPVPDVLIIENLPPFMQSKGSSFRTAGVVNLHRSVGAIMAGVDCDAIVEVSPQSWHAIEAKFPTLHGFTYKKADAHDAVMLGYAALKELSKYDEEFSYNEAQILKAIERFCR